jgi:hypothetical protein
MLDSTIELLGGLCLSALTLGMSLCIVGSIAAALRSVSRETRPLFWLGPEGVGAQIEGAGEKNADERR